MTRKHHRRRKPAALTALGVAVLLVGGCSKKAPQQQRPPVPVSVGAARRMDVPYTVTANGLVTPMQTAIVAAQVDGLVREVAFQEGQEVTAGQVLFRIDDRPYRAAYQQALASLARDRATAENQQRDATRYEALVKSDYVTKEQADQQRALASASAATVQADEAAVANAKFQLDNTTIRAPIAGRTGSLLVRTGNLVHASGNSPLVVINQIRPILVRFAVPATNLPLIQRYGENLGLAVTATPGSPAPARGSSSGGGGDSSSAIDLTPAATPSQGAGPANDPPASAVIDIAPSQGKLSFIDNAVDTTTGTVLLKATFPNENRSLWSGEFVSVSLQLFTQKNALVVPSQAVVTGQRGTYVYVIDSAGAAQQQPVSVERTSGNIAVIAQGLSDGTRVVTEGQARLTPGAKVSVNAGNGNGNAGGAQATPASASTARRPGGARRGE